MCDYSLRSVEFAFPCLYNTINGVDDISTKQIYIKQKEEKA
jgi:hypothetical protein